MESMLAQAARRIGLRRPSYERFVANVEPELLSRPRVHRFAAVPELGDAATRPAPLTVCVDPSGGGDAAPTRASLERQSVPPAAVVEQDLAAALAGSRAEWVLHVRAGDRLAALALERLGQAVTLAPDALIVTADDDLTDARGRRAEPRLRPGPSPDLWRAADPAFALQAVRREAAARVEATPYQLLLELGGPAGAGQAHVPMVLCHAAQPVVPRQPPRGGPAAPAAEPVVEAIVCFRDRADLLERSVRSLLERTRYERLSVRLVDNGSRETATKELAASLAGDRRVTLDADARQFNFSALNNAAAARSDADMLVFLNNDTETEESWLEQLLPYALRPEVGAVAPLLLYPDGRVQHAGVALGLHGWAGHPFAGLAPGDATPFGAAQTGPRNWLAVTAACMMVERRLFEKVGGFDERFRVGGGDVDLCLRLTAAGHRSLCVPDTHVVHDESASRDPAAIPPGDFEASRTSYGAFRTQGDPFYHPALATGDTRCRLRTEPGS
jgi:GT2 family glycosyltransferase